MANEHEAENPRVVLTLDEAREILRFRTQVDTRDWLLHHAREAVLESSPFRVSRAALIRAIERGVPEVIA